MNCAWTDGSITIRPIQMADAAAFLDASMESLDTVGRWFDWCHAGLTLDECRQWFRDDIQAWTDKTSYFFSVLDGASGRYLGSAWLNSLHVKHAFANLGYWVRRSEEGRGIATRTARWVVRFGFDVLDLKRIEVVVDVANVASQRLAEKLGAKREGLLRNRVAYRDVVRDAYIYSLIPADLSGSDSAG